MGKKNQICLLLTACLISGLAAGLCILSLGSRQWVYAHATPNELHDTAEINAVWFGLFQGTFRHSFPSRVTFELDMTCLFEKNICALLCGSWNRQKDDLLKLYYNQKVTFPVESCARIVTYDYERQDFWMFWNSRHNNPNQEKFFINAGLWLSTVVCLITSVIFGLFSAVLAFLNVMTDFNLFWLNTNGMYIYNSVAAFFAMMAIIFWGVLFTTILSHNVPCYQTLLDLFVTDNRAVLGYSYWIILVSLCLYLTSVFILFLRNYSIVEEAKKVKRRTETGTRLLNMTENSYRKARH